MNALLSDSDTRVLQNPRVRATDGQQATLKIGSKIPVATGSTTSTLTSTATATTQFTYIDVGVNIDMTPTVHKDGQVSLKMKIEISSETGTSTIDGVAEPVISQRVVQQVIQLKDGEPSILAGLFQQSNTKSVSGTPGLGELPFFKYFFSSQDKVKDSDEIVFLLIPHIVRDSVVTDDNTRVIDSGTSQAIELRRGDPVKIARAALDGLEDEDPAPSKPIAQPTSAANAANAMLAQMAVQALPVAAPSFEPEVIRPAPSVSPMNLAVLPKAADQNVGSTFQVAITASNARDLHRVPVQIQFDPKVLALVDVASGGLFTGDGQAAALVHRDEGNGLISISEARPPNTIGVTGEGTLCTLTFKAIAPGMSAVTILKVDAKNSKNASLLSTQAAGLVYVK